MRTSLVVLLVLLVGCKKKGDIESLPDDNAAAEAEVEAALAEALGAQQGGTTAPTGTTGPASSRATPKERVDRAASLLTTGQSVDAQQAVAELKAVLNDQPENAYAHYNLGVAYEIMGDYTSARDSYLEATRRDKELGAAYVNLAAMDMKAGQYERAMTRYRLGITNDRENMDLWVGLISALRELGRLDEAEAEARKALQINSNALNVYNNLGLVYIDRGQLDLANFIYQKALTTVDGGDKNASLHCNLGRIYQLQGKPADAKAAFDRALERDPDLVPAMLYLADYYLDNRNFQDTVPLLEKARTLEPENPSIHLNLGIAYRGVGRYEEAKAAYEQVLRLQPENPEPHLNLGILFGDYMKAYDAAVGEYEKYIAMGGPRSGDVEGYIDATRKEQEKVKRLEELKRKREEQQRKREAQLKALEEQKQQETQDPPTPPDGGAVTPDGGAPDGGGAVEPAPAEQPPADQPPADQPPPAEQPPADQPPADGAWGAAPADQPPADQPPAEEPPTGGDQTPEEGANPWGG
ncbi:MAG: tetratricopeptide repeat protein [Alphaproteobacteria bacterium]|nr:tetratricopeptide repeat protein [Alphaproteobacteria bacterium]